MDAQAANVATLQEMVQTMKAAMEAMRMGAQKGVPQGPGPRPQPKVPLIRDPTAGKTLLGA